MTDTDSFVVEIRTKDVYEDIAPDVSRWFDTSKYKGRHPSGMPTGVNKRVPGMFKDELDGKIMTEFVGLRAKMYAMAVLDGEGVRKAKGVPKGVVRKSVRFGHHKDCLFAKGHFLAKFYTLRSREHTIHTEKVTKVALSCDDTKRYLLGDGSHHTLAYGHREIPKGCDLGPNI